MIKMSTVLSEAGSLKWLLKPLLVLALIAFSGHVAEFSRTTRTLTELNEPARVGKITVCFTKALGAGHFSFVHSQSHDQDFKSFSFHYDNRILVRIKTNLKETRAIVTSPVLFSPYESTATSDDFDLGNRLG
jgi:hypothetical protein